MNSMVIFAGHLRQGFHVGASEFVIFPEFQNMPDNLMFTGKFRKHFFTGGILTCFCFFRFICELHFFKKNLTELPW